MLLFGNYKEYLKISETLRPHLLLSRRDDLQISGVSRSGRRGCLCGEKKKKDDDGFYKGAIRKGLEILSTEEVNKEKRWGFGDGPSIRSYPCYSDINDLNTLEWWLFWYET